MGKATRIVELETEIKFLKTRVKELEKIADDQTRIFELLRNIPEDAYALYESYGMKMQCEVGEVIKSALRGKQ